MTDRDVPTGPPPADEEVVPVGTEADEQQDTDAVLAEATASADEDALADAGLPLEGGARDARPPPRPAGPVGAPARAPRLACPAASTTVRPGWTSSATAG